MSGIVVTVAAPVASPYVRLSEEENAAEDTEVKATAGPTEARRTAEEQRLAAQLL